MFLPGAGLLIALARVLLCDSILNPNLWQGQITEQTRLIARRRELAATEEHRRGKHNSEENGYTSTTSLRQTRGIKTQARLREFIGMIDIERNIESNDLRSQ